VLRIEAERSGRDGSPRPPANGAHDGQDPAIGTRPRFRDGPCRDG